MPRPLVSLAVVALSFPGVACAQCDPEWDVGIGTPGIQDGYVEAATEWGGEVYLGGSFFRIGNRNIKVLARWNPSDGTYSQVGGGISTGNTNGFVTSVEPVRLGGEDLLVVGGFFDGAIGVPGTQSMAAWDGAAWRSLGTGFVRPEAVWGMTVGDLGDGERLYFCGGFLQLAGEPASGVAAWDGEELTVVGEGSGLEGFSPFVNSVAIWDDGTGPALYAVGRFDSIDGVDAQLAARYRPGTGWERIGAGVFKSSSTTTLDALLVFDDSSGSERVLIGGSPFRIGGQSGNTSVASWDGAGWTKVGQDVGGRVTDLAAWDDGGGVALYLSGTATPDVGYFARLDGGVWAPYLGGVGGPPVPPSNFPSVFGLNAYGDDLVVCGNFGTTGDGQSCAGVALIETCASGCVADWNGDGVVDTRDFIAFLASWSAGDADADLNGDGTVNTIDFIEFLGLWSAGC